MESKSVPFVKSQTSSSVDFDRMMSVAGTQGVNIDSYIARMAHF